MSYRASACFGTKAGAGIAATGATAAKLGAGLTATGAGIGGGIGAVLGKAGALVRRPGWVRLVSVLWEASLCAGFSAGLPNSPNVPGKLFRTSAKVGEKAIDCPKKVIISQI